MAAQPITSKPNGPPTKTGPARQARLLDVAERANTAAVLLANTVSTTHVHLTRSRKTGKSFVMYSKVISTAKKRPHGAAEHLLLAVAENTLKTLSQVYFVWVTRPRAKPFSEVEKKAFSVLVDPPGSAKSLSPLPDNDPDKAIEAIRKRIEDLGGDVAAAVETAVEVNPGTAEAAFEAASNELLKRAGGALSLTVASERLKVSRQRVHKRIQEGSMLGMRGPDGNLLIPAFQIEAGKDGERIIPGLEYAIRPFIKAGEGGWTALQWILDEDPNLTTTPLEAIRVGRVDEVARAAQAYVGADET